MQIVIILQRPYQKITIDLVKSQTNVILQLFRSIDQLSLMMPTLATQQLAQNMV